MDKEIYQVGIVIERTESQSIIVRVAAMSLKEAQSKALSRVTDIVNDGGGDLDDLIMGLDNFDWQLEHYVTAGPDGTTYSENEYAADIDMVTEEDKEGVIGGVLPGQKSLGF